MSIQIGENESDYINVFDFDNEENHIYFSYITYEDDTLENIFSASVRTDNIRIDDTATMKISICIVMSLCQATIQ